METEINSPKTENTTNTTNTNNTTYTSTKNQTIVQCEVTTAYKKTDYRSEELQLHFGGYSYNELVISDYQKEKNHSWDSKIPKNAYHENNHNKVIDKLLNCYGICNKHFDAIRPPHFACVSNRPIVRDSDKIKIPRLRIFDNLTNSFEILKVKIMDHNYNSKKFKVTWKHLLDPKSIEEKRKNETENGHSFQLNKPYFSPVIIMGIILHLIKKSKGYIHLDEKSYLDRIQWSFSYYPVLEITVYFHHSDKSSDYKLDQVMRNVMLSNILYKTKVDYENNQSNESKDKKIAHFDQVLPTDWCVHGVDIHAERQIKKKYCGYEKKFHKVQADLAFGKQIKIDSNDFKKIDVLQILYKDIQMPQHELKNLLESPFRFFDIVNLPSSDTSCWRFPDQYVPLRFKRSNKNIPTLASHEDVHIYPTRKALIDIAEILKPETTESTTETTESTKTKETIYAVEDNKWSMFIASQSEAYPIFLNERSESMLKNDFIHPYFTINETETIKTNGYYFVYRFIHIKTDCLRLYDIGITVKIFDDDDEIQLKPPNGKKFDLSHESFSAVIKKIEQIIQKKLQINIFRLPEKDQNPKYYVWTAKEHYPTKLDENSVDLKLKNLTDKPFFTVASYLNGVDRW